MFFTLSSRTDVNQSKCLTILKIEEGEIKFTNIVLNGKKTFFHLLPLTVLKMMPKISTLLFFLIQFSTGIQTFYLNKQKWPLEYSELNEININFYHL